ncbi:hypothetical protein CR513_40002, partial [Mucuna pruriens]
MHVISLFPQLNFFYSKYNYKIMLIWATYWGVMIKVFDEMMRKVVDIYVDDIIVKTLTRGNQVGDPEKVFNQLR